MKICRNCGNKLKDDARFCTSCGARVEMEAPQQVVPPKKKSIAPWIALIIGLFILLIVLICIAVVLIFGNPFAKEETVNIEPVQEQTEEESSVEEPDETVTEPETEEEEQSTEIDEQAWEEELNKVKRYNALNDVLSMFYCAYELPDETLERDYSSDIYKNSFAIADVDQDGQDELLIQITETYMAGMMLKIYDVDESKYSEELAYTCELTEFPSVKIYDNGVILTDWSHNQGVGETIWPYSIYTYDAASDTYVYRGNAECWDKDYMDTNYNGEEFPDDEDEDGDGTLYYVTDENLSEEVVTMDKEEYDDWLASYLGDASEMKLHFQQYEDTDIETYAKDYVNTYIAYHDALGKPVEGTDIGRSFLENGDYDAIIQTMKDAGVEMDEFEEGMSGSCEGDEVFKYSNMDIGSFTYQDKQVGDVNVLGIYPGIAEQDAVDALSSYGFYSPDEDMYITGKGLGNICVYLHAENKKVTGISMREYCGYAG